MQFVNDDMDEIFRRAAENYPLETSGADWNKVLQGLQQNGSDPKPEKNKGKGRLLWLLLLLPFSLICNKYVGTGNRQVASLPANSKLPLTPSGSNKPHAVPAQAFTSNGKDNPQSGAVTASADNQSAAALSGSVVPEKAKHYNRSLAPRQAKYNVSVQSPEQSNGNTSTIITGAAIGTQKQGRYQPELISSGINWSLVKHASSIALPDHPSLVHENSKSAPRKAASVKGFYVGLMGGVDATTIKFQKVDHAGYDYGLLVGYQFNKKWSVEAAAFMDKKFYYTDGAHFNDAEVYMPPNAKITDVTGDCKMFELPLSVQYKFSSSWFTSLGISSYFMKKEDYAYVYYYQSTNNTYTHYKTYIDGTRDLFTAIHISGGYTHPIGHIADLRIEPYLKIPIGKMGSSNLSLMSAGLHLGITRKLH